MEINDNILLKKCLNIKTVGNKFERESG